MHHEELLEYCSRKPGTTEEFPFDEKTLVFKVMGKMYALTGLERMPPQINLKCDPEYAEELRASYPGDITAGWHMSKKHWNTVMMEGDLDDDFIYALIDHSYELVVKKMPKKLREELAQINNQ